MGASRDGSSYRPWSLGYFLLIPKTGKVSEASDRAVIYSLRSLATVARCMHALTTAIVPRLSSLPFYTEPKVNPAFFPSSKEQPAVWAVSFFSIFLNMWLVSVSHWFIENTNKAKWETSAKPVSLPEGRTHVHRGEQLDSFSSSCCCCKIPNTFYLPNTHTQNQGAAVTSKLSLEGFMGFRYCGFVWSIMGNRDWQIYWGNYQHSFSPTHTQNLGGNVAKLVVLHFCGYLCGKVAWPPTPVRSQLSFNYCSFQARPSLLWQSWCFTDKSLSL